MSDMDQDPPLPGSLRVLKWLVILLTLSMIGGVITIVAVIVTRMPTAMSATPVLPADIILPEGLTAGAVTFGRGFFAVVATGAAGERILIFAPDGRLRQDVQLQP
jgi:Family of unknown function (DUF6476)